MMVFFVGKTWLDEFLPSISFECCLEHLGYNNILSATKIFNDFLFPFAFEKVLILFLTSKLFPQYHRQIRPRQNL